MYGQDLQVRSGRISGATANASRDAARARVAGIVTARQRAEEDGHDGMMTEQTVTIRMLSSGVVGDLRHSQTRVRLCEVGRKETYLVYN